MTLPAADQTDTGLALWTETELGGPVTLAPLAGDGGSRRYYRVQGAGLAVLYGPDQAENRAWFHIGRHLAAKGLPLPKITGADLETGFFLLDDLGDRHLADGGAGRTAYFEAVRILARLHQTGADGFDPAWCHQTQVYDREMVEKQEIGYFIRSLLQGYLKWPEPSAELLAEARSLAGEAAAPGGQVLIHRDYQGRNLMLTKGRVFFIDWQGARLGPAAYDLAALLQETPEGPLSDDFKEELIEHYFQSRPSGPWRETFRRELLVTGTARLMQALGAFAKLALSGKAKFHDYIEPALKILVHNFGRPPLAAAYPLLRKAAEQAWGQAADGV